MVLLTAACGDDGGGQEGDDGATPSDVADETTVSDDDDDAGEGDAAGALCERLSVEGVSTATGLVLDEVGPQVSQMTGTDYDVTATGCSFEGDGNAEVEVVVLDAEHDPVATFETLLEGSAGSIFDDPPHAEVAGLGDEAFFEAGLRQEELVVRVGDTVLFVEGTDGDGGSLGRAELQAVAELALAAIG